MAARRVFVDANVIIEAFRISVWSELSQGHALETVHECESEALTGDVPGKARVAVNAKALKAGLKASHPVTRGERTALSQKHPACREMDAGEKDLFAYLVAHHHPLPPLIVISSSDKGVIVRAKDLGWLDHLVSLEELLASCGVARSKLSTLDTAHHASFLAEVRTKVMLGIIP